MSSLDMTTFDAALKEHYTSERIYNMVYANNPFLALIPKYEEFGGKNLPVPIIYGNPQGRSAVFTVAKKNKTPSQIKSFYITREKDYSLASVDNETLEASIGDPNAFMEALATEVDGAIQSATRSLAVAMYGDGSGVIGTVGSIQNGDGTNDQVTLLSEGNITNFEIDMRIQFVNAGALINSGLAVRISKVDRVNGTINFVDDTTGVPIDLTGLGTPVAPGMTMVQEGDFNKKIAGLGSWIPNAGVITGSDNFFGVNRSVDPTRLGGINLDVSALPIEEALIESINTTSREGGTITHAFLSYKAFADLEKALGAKVQYVEVGATGNIGFKGIMVHGPKGPVRVIPDPNCPQNKVYGLQLDVWKMYSLGACVKMLTTDGNTILRETDADAVELRVGGYYQLGCRAPGYNFNATIS